MTDHLRAVLWAQLRIYRNFLPRRGVGGVLGLVFTAFWYGVMVFLAWALGFFCSLSDSAELLRRGMPLGLAAMTLYWQIAPIAAASTGAALDLRRLLAWPIPHNQLFGLEMLLRLPVSAELLILLAGGTIGLSLNPALPRWTAPIAVGCFAAFNLFFSAGIKNLLLELLERKRVRELMVFLFVILLALPQLVALRFKRSYLDQMIAGASHIAWPWAGVANLVTGDLHWRNWLLAGGWALAAFVFGRWQFERSLYLEKHSGEATTSPKKDKGRARGLLAGVFGRIGSRLHDPLGALVEKELLAWSRSPRVRLQFVMGFTFSLLIWVPLAFLQPGGGGWVSGNFLPFVGCYSLLLIGEFIFWNMFGLDRSAAQMYFVAPMTLWPVLLAKNIAGLIVVTAQLTLITAVCLALRLPLGAGEVLEGYAVVFTTSLYMFAAGNLSSLHFARGIDPEQSWRSSGGGKAALLIMLVLPLMLLPATISFMARFAFQSDVAFYLVLGIWLVIGLVVYGVATHSALEAGVSRREQFLDLLAHGTGPLSR